MLADVKVAVIQMVSGEAPEQNLAQAEYWVTEAANQGAQLIALPEYFPMLNRNERAKFDLAEHFGSGLMQDRLARLAQKLGIWLVAGSLPLKGKQADKVTNTSLVFDPSGVVVARYDKIHLFDFQKGDERYQESASIEAGQQPVCFDTPWARVGLGICYDLRFPELFRGLDDVDLLVIPAAFTVPTGRSHWELLLRARAVENQCYLMAPAQGGQHDSGRVTWGHSMVVDPWGEILGEQASGEGIVSTLLSKQRFDEIRGQLPAWLHRKL